MGRYDLTLAENEFWELTVKEFNAIVMRHKNAHDWLNYRAALICTVLANIWRGKRTKVFKVEDFMPTRGQREQKKQTVEQMLSTVKMLNAAFGGSVVEK